MCDGIHARKRDGGGNDAITSVNSMAKDTTTDDVMRLTRGHEVTIFNYEEWTSARVMWTSTGQKLGPIVPLFNDESGALSEPGIAQLREILEAVRTTVLDRELNSHSQGYAAGGEFFELVKKAWKLPYRHVTDSTDTVRIGAKKLGEYGGEGMPKIPTYGEVGAFRSAFDKFNALVQPGEGTLQFLAVGKRYLFERRKKS